MGLYSTAMEGVETYTGLTPPAFFTILALMFVVYKTVCGMFVDDTTTTTNNINDNEKPNDASVEALMRQATAPVPEPVQLGDVTEQELRAYDGSDPSKPLLMAIKGQIYDVSRSRMFYGPGGPYALFAGRDASRALALLSFDRNDLTGNLEGLSESELEVLQDWEDKFIDKYQKVGRIASEKTRTAQVVDGEGEKPTGVDS